MIYRLLLCVVALLLPLHALALTSPTLDAGTTSNHNNEQNPSQNHTRGASCPNPVAIIGIGSQDSTPGTLSSVTYGGAGATNLFPHQSVNAGNTAVSGSAWIYKNPGSGLSAVQANFSEVMNAVTIITRTFCNVDQTTSTGTVVNDYSVSTATPTTVTVSNAIEDLIVDIMVMANTTETVTVGAGQTNTFTDQQGGNHRQHVSQEIPSSTSTVMSWSYDGPGQYRGNIGFALKAGPDIGSANILRGIGVPGMNTYGIGGPLP